jgi:hypothetical protein
MWRLRWRVQVGTQAFHVLLLPCLACCVAAHAIHALQTAAACQ